MNTPWLSLYEYSHKYGMSISTLRRRIRSQQITFKLKNGKYLLKDQIMENPNLKKQKNSTATQAKNIKASLPPPLSSSPDQPFMDKFLQAQKTFMEQLQKKDQQIARLQTQLIDLKTLATLLEKENQQLKSCSSKEQELENWLEAKEIQ